MPELKNTFTGGRMDKDQDERIVPSGLYREALNVTVSTSEDSDVGAAQNILGNIKVTEAIEGPNNRYVNCDFDPFPSLVGRYFGTNKHVGACVNPETDMMYRMITTVPTASRNHGVWMDRIVEYDTTARREIPWYKKEKSVVVDIWKVRTSIKKIETSVGCNKTLLRVCLNSFQLRTGLRLLTGSDITNALGEVIQVTVESISYSGVAAEVTLDADISTYLSSIGGVGTTIHFHGDRNLNFDADRKITGINVIDGMVFWTDNYSEPKKINIERCKIGSDTFHWQNMNEVIVYGNFGDPSTLVNGEYVQGDAALSDFDQHTLLVVEGETVIECNKVEETCPSGGCTDPLADNYDASATTDDGSCNYPVIREGCTDVLACNYDNLATDDNGSCNYVGPCEYCNGGVVYSEGDISGPEYDAADPCNQALECFLNHYESQDPGAWLNDGNGNESILNGGLFSTNRTAGQVMTPGATTHPLKVYVDELHLPTWDGGILNSGSGEIGTVGFNNFWYWEVGTLADLNCSLPGVNGECIYPMAGFPASDPFRPSIGSLGVGQAPYAVKRTMSAYKIQMQTDDVNWVDHVYYNSTSVSTGHAGSLNTHTSNWPSWHAMIGDLQFNEGFDGVTPCMAGSGCNGGVTDLISITDTFDDVVTKMNTGFKRATATGAYDFAAVSAGERMTLGNTGHASIGDRVKYRIVQLDIPGDPNCVNWNEVGCQPYTNGKYIGINNCEDANGVSLCDPDDLTTGLSLGYSTSVFGTDPTYLTPYSGPSVPSSNQNYWNASSPLLYNSTRNNSLSSNSIGDGYEPPVDANSLNNPQYRVGGAPPTPPTSNNNNSIPGTPPTSNPIVTIATNTVGVASSGVSNINSAVQNISVNGGYVSPVIDRYTPGTVEIPIRGGFPGDDTVFDLACRPVYLLEKHITVIKKGPTAPPKVEMFRWTDDIQDGSNYGAGTAGESTINIESSFNGADMPTGTAIDGTDISIFFKPTKDRKEVNDLIDLPIDWETEQMDWVVNQTIVITTQYTDHLGQTKSGTCRAIITVMITGNVEAKILAISKNFPINAITVNDIYTVKAELIPPLFEMKFPKFAYRYKFEDGEYSVFGPWSEIAFMPGTFDYLPKKGYNLGMVNNMRSLKLLDWRPKAMPEDVVSIDLLYKESNSPNVYTVETFHKDPPDPTTTNAAPLYENWWQGDASKPGTGGNFGSYKITSELIHKVLPSNQMLRPWDNVPRYALAQEITANRLIFANYVQNYDLRSKDGGLIQPNFNVSLETNDFSIDSSTPNVREPMKSLKSMRTYQVGVVYRDRYGRETPVLTHESGSIELAKNRSKLQSRLSVQMNSLAPDWAESYTFYIKETSNEYYNLSMDRWYDAADDGVWLSFPSSERNKLTERSVIMLKKEHNTDRYVDSDVKYKVLDIKNDAPTFIKTEYKFWGSLPMMLPPPGWGTGNKAGTWDTGMFHLTGLPLPMRLYIDVYAEYFDQSVLAGLTTQKDSQGVQVRITQTIGPPSAYSSSPSQSVNKSNWYNVAAINYIGAPPETHIEDTFDAAGNPIEREVEVPGQQEQIVRLSLEQLMGDDMAFCIPGDNLSLSRGLALEARTKVVRDKSEFEGRFFAKVLRDEALQTHVVEPGQPVLEDTYQVLMSRDLKYLQFGSPGVQDYMTGSAGTTGAGKGKFYNNFDSEGNPVPHNYVPIGKRFDKIPLTHFGTKYEYATFSLHHGPTSYRTSGGIGPSSGATAFPPQSSGDYIPWGPSFASNHVLKGGWFFNSYYEQLKFNRAQFYNAHVAANAVGSAGYPITAAFNSGNAAIIPDTSSTNNYWPSHVFRDWEPTTCQDCGTLIDNDYVTGDWSHGMDLSEATVKAIVGIPDHNDLRGANPYMLGAIWGDQSDLLGYTGNANTGSANNPSGYSVAGVTMPGTGSVTNGNGNRSMWKKNTIEALRGDWHKLYYGRDIVDSEWPLGRHNPERWFIDKVSSAKGGSGNGIWDQDDGSGNIVSWMDVSYYGIGSTNTNQRNQEMLTHQENEAQFAELMATVGTQFRFKQDPNQTVYTITQAKIFEGEIYNYENSYGSWGYTTQANSTVAGGGNLGSGHKPPWGSSRVKTTSIASKSAFISDMYNSGCELTGGAPYNYRVRVTITLDKQIGSEGVAYGSANFGFHPILNHVDENGDCNIVGGAKIYSQLTHATSKGTITFPEELGGTPQAKNYFNLSSYWNTTTAPNVDQSVARDDAKYANGEHFGLHERGLNDTAIEIITPYRGDDADKKMSKNPGIWETEPMEDVGLDIYYAASPSYPTNVKRFRLDENRPDPTDYAEGVLTEAHYYDYGFRGEEIIPIGCEVQPLGGGASTFVTGVQGNRLWINTPIGLAPGMTLKFYWKGEGFWYGSKQDDQYINCTVQDVFGVTDFTIVPDSHSYKRSLGYFNCYTFSNGVESNRIRDDYNAITIAKGVKASMPLAQGYAQERKSSGLIFSGIYNSTSGVNETNQFIQAEPITKDLNPVNGSIQKLFTRDTDLLTFCENKVFKILAKKDALFNADGNTNITSNKAVLGNATPFVGEYGISQNPESFASESYRVYFADKYRGSIMRLSRDGLTAISDAGMKDWFKDNLYNANKIIGSFDAREDQYNVTIETVDQETQDDIAYTLSYVEKKRGWESFKSFIHEQGFSHKNIYYTFPSNKFSRLVNKLDPWGEFYATVNSANAEAYQHHIDLRIKRTLLTTASNGSSSIKVNGDVTPILVGMNVSGNGVDTGTIVSSVLPLPENQFGSDVTVGLSDKLGVAKKCYVDVNEEVEFTSTRNNFYEVQHYSQLTTLFNKDQGSVKRFKTLNYEGTQSQIVPKLEMPITNNYYEIYDDNLVPHSVGLKYDDDYQKDGWFVENIKTDMQEGTVGEFVDKENKWFNYIRGADGLLGNLLDTSDFSLQGLGFAVSVSEGTASTESLSGSGELRPGCIKYGCGPEHRLALGAAASHNPIMTLPDIYGNDAFGMPCDCLTPPSPFHPDVPFTAIDQSSGITMVVNAYCWDDTLVGTSDPRYWGYAKFPVDPSVNCDGADVGQPGCFPQVIGATDAAAVNYNPNASIPSTPCYNLGCMDILDINYDPDACFDDGFQCAIYND
tara:strand:+ start:3446 stop:12727 length:9282 start_codon:yes stop_codon:yes gene_type:complete